MRTQRCSRCDSKYKEPLSRVAIPWHVLRDRQYKRKQVLSVSLRDMNAEEGSGTSGHIKLEENETDYHSRKYRAGFCPYEEGASLMMGLLQGVAYSSRFD